MSQALTIAIQECIYWLRTKLGFTVALLSLILVCVAVFSSLSHQYHERHTRETLQIKAEETFRDQPARHPHRMVHYGHYVFRTPSALAALDPGVDAFTGTVIFLEGHRQNSATFSPSYDGAQAGPFSRLTPAFAYQLLVPLVLIIMGFSAVAREREAATDRQLITSGVSAITIWFGKTLALCLAAALMLLPMVIALIFIDTKLSLKVGFSSLYAVYLLTWVSMISAISTWSRSTSTSLLSLLVIWVTVCVLLPRLIASTANTSIPTNSQIETDMDVIVALRSVGDGHNANDPAFTKLKANLLEQYGVEKVEELPINFRGVVAQTAEAKLTDILNEYAEKRLANQVAQIKAVKTFEFVSPFLILQSASMISAGTDGRTHHRFLREAEAVRFDFVQGLNKAHETQMAYVDDINRSKHKDAEKRTRIDAKNWRVLNDFRFDVDPADQRLARVSTSIAALLAWLLFFVIIGFVGTRRLSRMNHG